VGTFFHDIRLLGADGQAVDLRGLVDTGALYSLIPASVLTELGVKPFGSMNVQFANGAVQRWNRGLVEAEMLGQRVPILVFFGEDDERVLIGAHTLEAFAYDVDVVKGELIPKSAAPMMGFDLV